MEGNATIERRGSMFITNWQDAVDHSGPQEHLRSPSPEAPKADQSKPPKKLVPSASGQQVSVCVQ
jgi:phosphorylase kinase alpha/beta subunit